MKIKNRQEFLVALTIGVVVLFVGVNWILSPLGGWWSARQGQIKQLRETVKEGRNLIKRDAVIRSQWREMQSNALSSNPSQAEQQFIKAMNGWSRDSGALVTSIMPQWKNDSTNYMTLTCRVETAGDLGTLSKFLYNLEKGPMALRLDSVELGLHANNNQQMTLGLELNGLALVPHDKK